MTVSLANSGTCGRQQWILFLGASIGISTLIFTSNLRESSLDMIGALIFEEKGVGPSGKLLVFSCSWPCSWPCSSCYRPCKMPPRTCSLQKEKTHKASRTWLPNPISLPPNPACRAYNILTKSLRRRPRCPSLRRRYRPRTSGYPCSAPCRSAGCRPRTERRTRESCRVGPAHPSAPWRSRHRHRAA